MAYRDRPADGENPPENQGQVDREAGRHDLKKHSHVVSSVTWQLARIYIDFCLQSLCPVAVEQSLPVVQHCFFFSDNLGL